MNAQPIKQTSSLQILYFLIFNKICLFTCMGLLYVRQYDRE